MTQSTNTIEQFHSQQYINLETYRRNGQVMRTPVWFMQEGDMLFVRTIANSGKVKRARNFPDVRVAPCDQTGNLRGEWVNGVAHLTDAADAERINALLSRKYGLFKVILDFGARLQKRQYATLMIRVRD